MRIIRTVSAFIIGLMLSAPLSATTVLPATLEYMSKAAELVFHGRAVANEVKIDELSGRVATFTTFEVIEVIKGEAGDTHTIKQLGGQLPGSSHVSKVHGVPRFTAGVEYVVFLPKASELGFASPVGLGQGRFTVSQQEGIATVSNGRSIQGLVSGPATLSRDTTAGSLQPLPGQPASALLADFVQSVRELARKQ